MFRRFIPVNTVAVVGAQFAFASTKKSKAKASKAIEAESMSSSEIKAANKKAAKAVLGMESSDSSRGKSKFNYAGAKKKDLPIPSPSYVNPEAISTKAYSQALGFNKGMNDNSGGKLNRDVSGTEFDRKVYAKSDKLSGERKDFSKDASQDKNKHGAASHTGPQVATTTKDEEQKMDYEGAMRPATAAQMESGEQVETNYDIKKKAAKNNQAASSQKVALSDAPLKDTDRTHGKDVKEGDNEYNIHNLPPTPLQELGSAISNMASKLFNSSNNSSGNDSSVRDQKDSKISSEGAASHTGPQVATTTKDEEQKMDYEGAMRPATAAQMESGEQVETNYDIKKKAAKNNSNNRISSSSGESQQSFLKSNSGNASQVAGAPSSFTLYGTFTPQAASHEAYATSSTGTSHETADSYNKKIINASDDGHSKASSSPLEGISSTLSSMTGGFFTRGSDAYPQYAGAQIQPTAHHAGPAAHTLPQDANPFVSEGSSASEAKNATSAQAGDGQFNISSLKKEPKTDYSSPDYLVRRT